MSSLRPPPKLLILLLKIKAPNHSLRAIKSAVHGKICRLLSGAFLIDVIISHVTQMMR
jgi:hypothetical protein